MHYILYFMLFTTPPAAKGHEVWSLQTSTSMEFNTFPACESAVNKIIGSIEKTDTVRLFGWCFPKGGVSLPGVLSQTVPLAETPQVREFRSKAK